MKDPFGLFIIEGVDQDLADIRCKKHEVDHNKEGKAL